jgi:hypothetical protein
MNPTSDAAARELYGPEVAGNRAAFQIGFVTLAGQDGYVGVAIRNTRPWWFQADRKVAEAGHGDHGGWYIVPDKWVQCGGCDARLFPLADVAPPEVGQPPAITARRLDDDYPEDWPVAS